MPKAGFVVKSGACCEKNETENLAVNVVFNYAECDQWSKIL